MPDWAQEVRERLSSLRLTATREREIVDELAQHLQDRYTELIAAGASPEEATRLTLSEFQSSPHGDHSSEVASTRPITAASRRQFVRSVLTCRRPAVVIE